MTIQTVTLNSPAHFGRRVPSEALGGILRHLPESLRQSVRMAVEGRSRGKGKRPSWLRAAADIRFLGHDGEDETRLHFEAPTLGEAAGRLYDQREFWPTMPEPRDTGFDVLASAFNDVSARFTDSDRFDRPLLDSLAEFGKIMDRVFSEMIIPRRLDTAGGPVVVTTEVAEIARSLYTNTPQPQRVRIVGKLDMVRASTSTFGILLDDGVEIRGTLIENDIEAIGQFLNQRVLVLGKAVYRASGRPLRIDAETVTKSIDENSFFSTIPKPIRYRFDLKETVRDQQHKVGLTAAIGKWPGDETEEEIRQALQELS